MRHRAPLRLFASGGDRERVVERVRAAVTDGRPVLDESDGRLDQVHRDRAPGRVAVAVRGLPEPGPRDSPVADRAPTPCLVRGG
ncbi:DUF1707 domain-containing protein [Streptomyces sp. MMS24-I2-30]|uniref:DUF1707 domain-containing protein n=1 Tax=Streptomyces sp. MMS24-I2-30 TaxID=3351564 RepID=UPI003896AF15